jgi:hypothetical protein
MGWGGGSVHPLHVTEAVEKELWNRDNRTKLRHADGQTRHLFVWVQWSAWRAPDQLMDHEDALPPAPDLPPQVDFA